MAEIPDIDRAIRERLAAREARRAVFQSHTHERMEEIERQQARFGKIAERLASVIIRPRLAKVASYFDNAELVETTSTGAGHCACHFRHTSVFPATTSLEFMVGSDEQYANVIVAYQLEILPIYFQFQGRDQAAFPVDRCEDSQVALWIDRKIIDFVDTYLRLEDVEPYQQENIVTDPVCGMRINKNTAKSEAEYCGRRFYFCIDECRARFLKEPERWISERLNDCFAGETSDG